MEKLQGNLTGVAKHVTGRISALLAKGCNIVLPGRCAGCGDMIVSGHGLCASCFNGLDFISDPVCECCGIPFEIAIQGSIVCPVCAVSQPMFDCARAALYYNEASRHIIAGFKYADRTELSALLGDWMWRAASGIFHNPSQPPPGLVVPVPLHRTRLFSRRYNQAALLCKSLNKKNQTPCVYDALKRVRKTKVQAGLKRNKRFANVRGAFAVNNRADIAGRHVLLVDDVLTTGATLSECARQLKKGGASRVSVLTVARVVQPITPGA